MTNGRNCTFCLRHVGEFVEFKHEFCDLILNVYPLIMCFHVVCALPDSLHHRSGQSCWFYTRLLFQSFRVFGVCAFTAHSGWMSKRKEKKKKASPSAVAPLIIVTLSGRPPPRAVRLPPPPPLPPPPRPPRPPRAPPRPRPGRPRSPKLISSWEVMSLAGLRKWWSPESSGLA